MPDAMPESHWVDLTIQRIEKLRFDSVARKYMSPELQSLLLEERARLITICTELLAKGD